MPKVTVYVSDDQIDQLKAVRGFGRGGMSKLFQAFLESATSGSGSAPQGRYDYARKLMPLHAAIDRHRRSLARKVQAGGPPADGGPVAAALTVLLYKRLLDADPANAAALEKEFARFGLDELVATETDGVDLLAEPDVDDEVEEGDGGSEFDLLAPFGIRIGDEVREALRQVQAIKLGVRDLRQEERSVRRMTRHTGRRGGRLRIEISPDDDPRDLLTATDFATFGTRHDDWKEGDRLSPSQMETVRELLIRRAGGDPDVADEPDESDVPAAPEEEAGE